MAHNERRATRMLSLSDHQLKLIVDSGSLSAAAARYALAQRGIVYTAKR